MTHKEYLVGLHHCANFGLDSYGSFDSTKTGIFCTFGLKTPIDAPKMQVFEHLTLKMGCNMNWPQKAHLCVEMSHMAYRSSKSVKLFLRYSDFHFINMAAVCRLGFVGHTLSWTTKSIWWFYHYAKFGLNWFTGSSFDGTMIWIFCAFGLKTPICAPNMWGSEAFDPQPLKGTYSRGNIWRIGCQKLVK